MHIAIDTETALIHRACCFPPISCLTYADENGATGIYAYLDNKIAPFVADALERGDHLIMHKASFDTGVLAEEYPDLLQLIFQAYENGQIHCTLIRQRLLDIALGLLSTDESGKKNTGFYTNKFDGKRHPISYSLKALHYRRTGEDLEKGQERVTFGPLRDVPLSQWSEKHKQYAIKDAVVTLPIFQAQADPRVAHYLQDEIAQTRAAFALQLITAHGLRTDPVWVEKLRSVTAEEIAEYEPILQEINWLVAGKLKQAPAQRRIFDWATHTKTWPKLTEAGEKIRRENARAKKTTGLVDENGILVLIEDPTLLVGKAVTEKQLAADKEAAYDCGDPDLIMRAKYVSARGILTKTIPVLEQGYTLPIQPSYDPLLATGRTSSYGERQKKKSDPLPSLVGDNIQNQKRRPGTRECYVPRPGYVFCSIDYDSVELHALAQICYTLLGKSKLGDLLNSGIDPHTWFASRILDIAYDEAVARKKEGDKHFDGIRTMSKAADFGYSGGSGADGFRRFAKAAYGVVLTHDKAVELKDAFLAAYPEMPDYFKYVAKEVRAGRGKAQIRHLVSNRYRGGCRFTVACNTRFQGLAADGAKAAMWELIKACYLPGYNKILFGVRIVAFVHDEFIFEIRDVHPYRSLAAHEAARIMIEQFNKFTPDCPITASPVLMRRWSKNAKAIYDKDGYLVPWNCTLKEIFDVKSEK